MASIQTGIELNDGFTGILNNIISSVNLAVHAMEDMQRTMDADIDTSSLEGARSAIDQATMAVNELEASMRDTAGGIRDEERGQRQFNRAIDQGVASAGNLRSMVMGAVGAFAGMAGIRKTVSWIEECTEAFDTQRNAELQLMTVLANTIEADVVADASEAAEEISSLQNQPGGVAVAVSADTQALSAAFDAITAKASEIQGRGIYGDEAMIAGAAEFSTYFTDTDAIEMMMDTLADYAMGMSGGGELDSAAMVEYATGLGKIMSGSYDAMTKKGFEFTEAQKAVIEGTATQEQIIAAIGEKYLDASEDVRAAAAINAVIAESWDGLYESMSDTPQGKIIQMTNAWGDMKEVVGGQLYPYVILFVDAITSHWGTIQAVLDGITLGLQAMMGILSWLLAGALDFAQAVEDNWSWVSPIIYGIVAALALYAAYQGVTAGATMLVAAAQWAWNAAMSASPITWIIILIITLVAAIFAVCNAIAETTDAASSGFGVMAGGVNVVIQFFRNLGLAVANIALGIWYALGALCENMKTAFHNAIWSVQSWWYVLLATGLTVIEGICAALNKLPFVEFDYSGISGAADDYAAKAAEAAGNKQEYESVGDAFNKGYSTFDSFQDGWVSDAFAAGAAWGDGIADKVGDFSLTDLFAAGQVPTMDDYVSGFGDAVSANGVVGDIAGNTADIKDSLDCTEEDLKYLRDIAEQESVNRYTLADLKIEQTNYNNISSDMDLDGIVSGLTDAVGEAVESTAEGVHE